MSNLAKNVVYGCIMSPDLFNSVTISECELIIQLNCIEVSASSHSVALWQWLRLPLSCRDRPVGTDSETLSSDSGSAGLSALIRQGGRTKLIPAALFKNPVGDISLSLSGKSQPDGAHCGRVRWSDRLRPQCHRTVTAVCSRLPEAVQLSYITT